VLLVYPFNYDEEELSKAASGLKELGGDSLGLDRTEVSVQSQVDGDQVSKKLKKSKRTHYVTIRVDDKERLCPGKYLNDTLVDFWMRW
jgi:Ulp1 family protease